MRRDRVWNGTECAADGGEIAGPALACFPAKQSAEPASVLYNKPGSGTP